MILGAFETAVTSQREHNHQDTTCSGSIPSESSMVLLRRELMTLAHMTPQKEKKQKKKPEVWVNEKSISSQMGTLSPQF